MHNGRKTNMNTRHPNRQRQAAQSGGRRMSATRPTERYSQRAKNYERYLALAQAEAQSGNTVAARLYEHAEHYFRSTSTDTGGT